MSKKGVTAVTVGWLKFCAGGESAFSIFLSAHIYTPVAWVYKVTVMLWI